MVARTRAQSALRRSANKRARTSVKRSRCRGSGPAVCRSKPNCKYASGKKRNFCRKVKNTRRRRSVGGTRRRRRGGSRRSRR